MAGRNTTWWNACDNCDTTVVIQSVPGRPAPVPEPDDWEHWPLLCQVCGQSLGPWSSDPQVEAVRPGDVAALKRVYAYAAHCGFMRVEPTTAGLRSALEAS